MSSLEYMSVTGLASFLRFSKGLCKAGKRPGLPPTIEDELVAWVQVGLASLTAGIVYFQIRTHTLLKMLLPQRWHPLPGIGDTFPSHLVVVDDQDRAVSLPFFFQEGDVLEDVAELLRFLAGWKC